MLLVLFTLAELLLFEFEPFPEFATFAEVALQLEQTLLLGASAEVTTGVLLLAGAAEADSSLAFFFFFSFGFSSSLLAAVLFCGAAACSCV